MKFLFLISTLLVFIGCDPKECAQEVIENKSLQDLYIYHVSSIKSYNDTTFIESKTSETIGEINCSLGGVVLDYSIYDSIFITDESLSIKKVFLPSDSGRNIFKVNDSDSWKIESKKNDKKYIFTITEEDLQ